MIAIFRKVAIPYRFVWHHRGVWQTRGDTGQRPSRILKCLVMIAVLGLWPVGCTDPPSQQAKTLIRSGDATVSLAQFERAFTTARIAYSDDGKIDPVLLQEARLRFLHQLVQEVIMARRAAELGIVVDDDALKAAVEKIKADYPEGEFDKMLLESAIPLTLWQERLRARLLTERVVQADLIDSMVITAQEIETYYRKNTALFQVDEEKTVSDTLKRRIVAQLRREKVEKRWPEWMEGLKARLGVDINWELWEQAQKADDRADRRAEENGS